MAVRFAGASGGSGAVLRKTIGMRSALLCAYSAEELFIIGQCRAVCGPPGIAFSRVGFGTNSPSQSLTALPDSPFCRYATSVPLFVTCGDISPRRGENLSRPGEAVLWDGASGTPENFAAMPKAPSLRELVRRKPRLREFPLDNSPHLHYNTSKMNHSKMKGQTCCEPEYRIFHQDRAGVQCRL